MDVDDPYEALPPYVAVIVCEPPVRAVVETAAVPFDNAADAVQLTPSENVTVPVGVPPGPVTVAVNVTEAPYVVVAKDCTRLVVEPALDTFCVRGAEVEPGRFESPL